MADDDLLGEHPEDSPTELGGDDIRIWLTSELHETPVVARARCKRIGTQLTQAQLALRRERRTEVEAEIAYRSARRRAQMASDAPKVERGGYTVADKEAWVDDAVQDEYLAWRLAELARVAAQETWKRLDQQGIIAQAMLKSVDIAFRNVNTGEVGS
jgi:hypothetical protein